MKTRGLLTIFFSCFLVFACGTTQQTISESSEDIEQAFREGKLIKAGDWVRATTLDGRIHEFSYVGVTQDELQGGDAIIALSQIRQIEVFPLLRLEGKTPSPRSVLNDAAFEEHLSDRINADAHIVATVLINGKAHTMWPDGIGQNMLQGRVLEFGEYRDTEYEFSHMVNRKLPISIAVRFHECHWHLLSRICNVNESINRWSDSEDARLAALGDKQFINSEDWVRVILDTGQTMEFQYKKLRGTTLLGGDGSVAVANIVSMEIYPVHVIAPPEMSGGEKVGAAFAAVAVMGLMIIMTGGLAAPVFVMP